MAAVTIRMSGLEGRLQWRQHKPFKLRAKRSKSKNVYLYQIIICHLRSNIASLPAPLFAF
jgi:hypothetical protein